jgi:hypothetical protein
MENAVQTLASFFDHGGGDVSGKRLDALFGEHADFLLGTGIFGPANGHAEAPCRCPQGDHTATVSWNEAKAAYRARCPKGDRYWLDPADAETHAFDPAAFCREVGRALGVAPRKGRNTIDGRVHYSGDAMLGKTSYPIFFVREALSPETLDIVLGFDKRSIGKTRGVFLCGTLPAEIPRRDSFHAFVMFNEVLDLQDGQLRRRPEALRWALGDAIRKMSPAEVTSQLESVVERYRRASGDWPTVRGLADLAATAWPENQKPPSKTKCEEVLKQMRASRT